MLGLAMLGLAMLGLTMLGLTMLGLKMFGPAVLSAGNDLGWRCLRVGDAWDGNAWAVGFCGLGP